MNANRPAGEASPRSATFSYSDSSLEAAAVCAGAADFRGAAFLAFAGARFAAARLAAGFFAAAFFAAGARFAAFLAVFFAGARFAAARFGVFFAAVARFAAVFFAGFLATFAALPAAGFFAVLVTFLADFFAVFLAAIWNPPVGRLTRYTRSARGKATDVAAHILPRIVMVKENLAASPQVHPPGSPEDDSASVAEGNTGPVAMCNFVNVNKIELDFLIASQVTVF